jgi:hypothetical protein
MGQDTLLSVFTERVKIPPFGLKKGLAASPGRYELKRNGEIKYINTKLSRLDFPQGAALSVYTPGGGGYGDPYEREPERVMEDFLDGLVSRRQALEVYGVVINESEQLDLEATAKRRQSTGLYREVEVSRVINTDERGPDRTIGINQQLAQQLQLNEGQLVEVTNDSVPLRGWAQVSTGLGAESISLPALFAQVLGIQIRGRVKLRVLPQQM